MEEEKKCPLKLALDRVIGIYDDTIKTMALIIEVVKINVRENDYNGMLDSLVKLEDGTTLLNTSIKKLISNLSPENKTKSNEKQDKEVSKKNFRNRVS